MLFAFDDSTPAWALAIQAIGLTGTVGGILWPLFPTRIGMLAVQLATNLCFTLHFALLGAGTAAAVNGLSAAQVLAAIPLGARPGFRHVYLAILPLIAAALVTTWSGPPSMFAAVGAALISVGRYQTDLVRFRLVILAALPFWLAHNAMVGSIPGMISDTAGMVLNAVVLLRMRGALRRRPA